MDTVRKRRLRQQAIALASGIATGIYETQVGGLRRRGTRADEKQLVVYDKDFHNPREYFFKKNKMLAVDKMPRTSKKSTRRLSSSRKFTQQKNGSRVSSKKPVATRRRTRLSLRQEVRMLKKSVASDQAYHCHKRYETGAISSAVAQCNHTNINYTDITYLEAMLTQLRVLNPATGALTTYNPASGSTSQQIHFKNFYGKLELVNNYQVPCRIKVYLCRTKADTSISPVTYYTNGITDQVISGGNATTPGIFMTDIDVLKEQWSLKVLKDVVLDAGSRVEVTHSTGPFNYDPSLVDSHPLSYQTKYKAFTFVVRIEGLIGHDSAVAGQQTNLSAAVDYIQTMKADIIYDAGVNLNDIYITDNRDATFTNGGLVTNKPIADNQAYAAA